MGVNLNIYQIQFYLNIKDFVNILKIYICNRIVASCALNWNDFVNWDDIEEHFDWLLYQNLSSK